MRAHFERPGVFIGFRGGQAAPDMTHPVETIDYHCYRLGVGILWARYGRLLFFSSTLRHTGEGQ